MCSYLQKCNIPPSPTQDGWTCFILAAQNGHLEVVQHLLDKGADINATNKVVPHAPPEHTCPAPHVVPHAPQLALSVCRFAQLAPHTVSPAPQFGRHVPAEHAWPAGQCVPHAPQLWSSVRRFTHSVPHAVCPAGHDTLHIPAMQTLPAGQTVPQVPQLERSDARSAQ